MDKLKELVEELKRITNLSQPNIKYKEQMDVIEALEAELNNHPVPLTKSEIVDQSLNEVLEVEKWNEIELNDPLIQKLEEPQLTEEEKEQLDKLEFERALEKRKEQAAIENEKSKQRGRKKKEQQDSQE